MSTHRRFGGAALGIALWALVCAGALANNPGPRFFPDDPLEREPESQDASRVQPSDVGLVYDLAWNLFVTSRAKPSNIRARNVNTIDEVPDSGWFTNRILPRRLSLDDFVRGANTGPAPNPEQWTFTREKSAGYSPGFTAKDANGETWFLSFDSPGHPEGATAAMVVASKIFWALGYNQVETFITTVDPRRLKIDSGATIRRPNGKRTPAGRADVEAVLERAARNADGTYRAAAGRLLPGKVLGPFRYEGTRPDDPNDLVDHQHRRELRALRVFGAWTNLTDMKAGNTLDTLVNVDGRSIVRHYLQDVGSSFGIGANGAHDWDEGFEYFYESGSSRRRLLSLGFAFSPWQTADYILYPSIGRFESNAFDPPSWKPHAATAAYIEMQPDDAFWAARRVVAFDDELIRALVRTGQFSDPAAERHLATLLIERRDKVARAFLAGVSPLVNPRLGANGDLAFDNAAADTGVAQAPQAYIARWWAFDNESGQRTPLGESRGATGSLKCPVDLQGIVGEFVQVDVSTGAERQTTWPKAVTLTFSRTTDRWRLVGLER